MLSAPAAAAARRERLSHRERLPAAPERILILGWNGKGQAIIEELDNYVAPGSETIVICRHDGVRDVLMGVAKRMQRQKVRFADGDITHARRSRRSRPPRSNT